MGLEPILERAKRHLDIKSDADLARHLGITDRNCISIKKRNRFLINI